MVLTKLFQSIGMPITARNFMVDYCDSYGSHFHESMQIITPSECLKDGIGIVTRIQTELRQQGFTVCGILEALGGLKMNELENIFNDSDYDKYPTRVLYIDVKVAKKKAHP